MTELADWLTEHKIDEVECLVPDINGIARGKILPAAKFIKSLQDESLRLPESIFIQTVTGEYSENADYEDIASDQDPDMYLRPDPDTIRIVPWYTEPTAQVICDAFDGDGKPVEVSARHVLRKVLALYAARGWKPVVAPELEFFLVQVNTDPDLPLLPPVGRSGRTETGRQSYGIDATNEFDPIFEDVYDFCEAQEIDIDTLTHEAGAAQMEINFNHGDALVLADQAFLFKRTVRQAAMRHNIYATFMAKPLANQPGSSMHIHQSLLEASTGRNLFADKLGRDSALFRSHVGGAAALPAPGDAAAGAQCEFLPAPPALFRRPHQRPMGRGQPVRGLARSDLGRARPADREPARRGRCQSLSRHRRLARLRLSRHDRADEADQADRGQRLSPAPHPAAHPL